ncbi:MULTISPECIES: SDR family oxidoreductase [unclassified Minwuia]|jgi:NAD(P)-dependent dehydrogenase (short-subunit alcohol dehydrogenase family)|uniref:SDR family NAD(P)-dependent oxidoreductase n=1 Tax=unclassified Minwuia TaxID=2618799 RepID=UPI0024792C3B|nr:MULTISPECIES: SDR family oxidoreductase [unclassified Minwuia]
MKHLFDITGKVAVVTGGSKGIGKAIAQALAAHGAKVVVASRKLDACQAVVDGIRADGGDATAISCNITNREDLEKLVRESEAAYGQIDIMVANAAVNPFMGSNLDIPDDAFQKIMTCNVQSNLWLAQMVIPGMQARKDGAFIIVSSIGGLKGDRALGAYAISKAADFQLARNLAVEFGKDNIRVNCIAPGLVKTDFAKALWTDPERSSKRLAGTPMARLGEPEDLAGIAVYLAAPAGSWTTGQVFVVDGGVMAGASAG